MIDKELIFITVERIKKTLNRRFEKDADFYISNQDIQEVKKLICLSNFETIAAWLKMKRFSAEILTKVILTNAWLIQPLPYNKIKELINIIKQCNPVILPELMEEIISNQIDVSLDLKLYLEPLYYKAVPIETCQQVLDSGHRNIEVLKICYKRMMSLFYSSNELYKKSKSYFHQYPDLSKKIGKIDICYLNKTEQNAFLKLILEQEVLIDTSPVSIWINTINSFKKEAFDISIQSLNTVGQNDSNFKKKNVINLIIFRLINYDINNSYYINEVIDLYHKKPELRFSLILGLRKINNLNIAQNILAEYESIGIEDHPMFQEVIFEIKTGNKKNFVINDINDILIQINNKPLQHIKYISRILLKNPNFNQLFEEFFSIQYIENSTIQTLIIETIVSSGTRLIGISLNFWNIQRDENLKEKLLILFSKDEFKTSKTKQFVYENNFNLYQRLYGKGV